MSQATRKISNRPTSATQTRIAALAVLDLRAARRIAHLNPHTLTVLDLHIIVTDEARRAQLRSPKMIISVGAAEARAANYMQVDADAPAVADGYATAFSHLAPCAPVEDGRAIVTAFIDYLTDVTGRAANDVYTTNATHALADLIIVAEQVAQTCQLGEQWQVADHVEETMQSAITDRFSRKGYPHYLTVAVLPYVLALHATRTYDAPCIRCDAQAALLAADVAGDHVRADRLRDALMNGSDEDVYYALGA